MRSFSKVSLLACSVLALAAPVSALTFNLDAVVGAEWESNAAQGAAFDMNGNPVVGDQEDTGINYGLLATAEHRTGRWDFGGNYSLSYIDYLEDVNGDETLFAGTSELIARVVPGFFDWSVTHSRQNEQTNQLVPNTPDNREVRQVVTTQPVLYWRVASGDQIITSARYVDVNQETNNNNDSQRWGLAAGWRRELSAVSQFSLNTEYSQVDFEAADADFELARFFIDYSAQLRVLDYSIQAGVSHIEREIDTTLTAEFLRLVATYTANTHRYTLTLLDELTDSSIALADVNFALNIDNRGDNNVNVFDNANLVTQRQATFRYDANVFCRSCNVNAEIGVLDFDFETDQLNQRSYIGTLGLGYDYSQSLSFNIGATYNKAEFDGAANAVDGFVLGNDAAVEQIVYVLGARWQVTRRFSTELQLSHETQEAEDTQVDGAPNGDQLDFDNDSVMLQINYRLW